MAAGLVAGVLVSCGAGGGGGGAFGDMGGADPEVGGISEVPNPDASMAAKSGKALGQLERGHETYMLKCAECHNYKLPHQIDVGRWQAGALQSECGSDIAAVDARAVVDYVSAVKSR